MGPLHGHNARVTPDLPGQLTVSNVDGENFCCTLLKKTVGESAGGCAGIAANVPGGINAKIGKSLLQLPSASADIGTGVASDFNFRIRLDFHAGFIGFLIVDIDFAGQNNGLCLASALDKLLFHQKDIQAFFIFHCG